MLVRFAGHVTGITPSSTIISGLEARAKLGDLIEFEAAGSHCLGEIVSIGPAQVVAKPFDADMPIGLGCLAWHRGPFVIQPHPSWRGRTLSPLAIAIDGAGPLSQGQCAISIMREAPNPLRRRRIVAPIITGVRVVDFFTPLCAGQRIGIFAGSGVGKSTLLSMLARGAANDTIVMALVGERGREVREFLEGMAPQARERTIAIVSTGDQSPSMRRLAPLTAMTIAEYFRDMGQNVLLIVDSITRYAHAVREIGLATGEPPVARGYTPNVFSELPRLLERAGPGEGDAGCITGIFSVLVDGDDHNDPIADSIRGTLDGHIVLSRAIADQGRYPAVDPLSSVSRLAHLAWSAEQRELVLKLRGMLSLFEETRDVRLIGGYRQGSDQELDKAIAFAPKLIEALKQSPESPSSADALAELSRALHS